ncbi:MAG TPA: ADP-ribosylglycohydrolase family protein, partial [Pyrinomonadaceae bacterium]|nr:ADP-ribosylglycohydrolase family protein [Pyrinomonadaceae bacterium]
SQPTMAQINKHQDRIHGCLLGGAIGDAMGGPFEGKPGPLRFREHSDWKISDDTQLTLATCESIVELGRVSPEHIADCFTRWFRERRITRAGSSTLKALRDLDAGAHWALSGRKGEMSAGNGAAMRIAPLAFHLDPTRDEDRQIIRDVCRITHHNDDAYAGALAVLAAIRWLAFDLAASPTKLFETVSALLPDTRVRDRIMELAALPDDLTVAEIASQNGASGYVVESVPLALYAARQIDRLPLEVVLRNAIEAGGDTDTIASMAGQVAGAWIGASEIPRELIDSLPPVSGIENTIHRFARMNTDERLFAYGTLQLEKVQIDTFGRRLEGKPDALVGYRITMIEVRDPEFVAKAGSAQQRSLQYTGVASDIVEGTVLELTEEELEQADAYEPVEYRRELVQLRSGAEAWIYLCVAE